MLKISLTEHRAAADSVDHEEHNENKDCSHSGVDSCENLVSESVCAESRS